MRTVVRRSQNPPLGRNFAAPIQHDGRFRTLAMLAHAYLAVVRRRANECFGGKKGGSRNGMKP